MYRYVPTGLYVPAVFVPQDGELFNFSWWSEEASCLSVFARRGVVPLNLCSNNAIEDVIRAKREGERLTEQAVT